MNAHYSFSNTTLNNGSNIKAIFLGASITDFWPDSIFDQKYAPFGAVNYGNSGDGVEHALWRIQNGEISDGLKETLKLIVFSDCGSNNVANHNSDDIVRGYKKVIKTIKKKLPKTRVILMGLMPRDNGKTERWTRLMDINIKNSKHDTGEANSTVKYLDVWTQFSKSWEVVEPSLFLDDQLHLTNAGYLKWAQIIDPIFHSLIA